MDKNETKIDRSIKNARIKDKSDWLTDLREKSRLSFGDLPMPGRVAHLWRYSSPESFLIDDSELALPVSTNIRSKKSNADYIHSDLETAVSTHKDLIRGNFGKLIGPDFGKFEALNLSLWNTGQFLYVPDNVTVKEPIHIRHLINGNATVTRLLIIVGKNAGVKIIDEYATESDHVVEKMNGVVEIFAGDNSNTEYFNLQNVASNVNPFITYRSQIGKNASIKSVLAAFGGKETKVNAGTILSGKGSESRIQAVIFGTGKQRFDYHTFHHHTSDESYSNIDVKTVLKGKADSAYTGLIRIEKETRNCQAYQLNRNLLLNRGARAESIPELEILSDEVMCSHGATMGPIDPEMLFYLKTRGIEHNDATSIIVRGFVDPIIEQFPEEMISSLRSLIDGKIRGDK
jgi:Fe-S cluster assembly protein SufD